ncbi:6-phospho-3-hexuloisomerase [bacterium 1XD8-76]|nr:6-phospho-3-hexuloisomerase [bacterium 1XD8-76]
MKEVQYLLDVLEELKENAEQVDEREVEEMAAAILRAKRVYVAGAGRSGFAARAFANRLMHLGLTVFFAGEPTTPAIGEGDLLIIGSGSGETESLVVMAQKARRLGADVATVTIHPEASIGKLSASCLVLPGATPKSGLADTCKTIQIMGNAFEQMTWIVYDVIIMYLMKKLGISEEEMFARHANLE